MKNKEHRFSGWPGAHCLDCGSEDPYENALALGWLDVGPGIPETWDTEKHKKEVEEASICSKGV